MKIYLVGGAVRDKMMGITPKDAVYKARIDIISQFFKNI